MTTTNMKVENTGFLLERLGRDCAPLQFVRELFQNSMEACAKNSGGEGDIVWDLFDPLYDLPSSDVDRKVKLSIADNGIGMTGEEMERYINNLSSSSGIQSHVANYGVGAKIAAATKNPQGLIYLSWKDGQGSMVHLWKDPATGNYGLREFGNDETGYSSVVKAPDDFKPAIIKDHGTVVILLGESEDANTMLPPKDTPQVTKWIGRYLNTRYFRLPESLNVKTREGRFTTDMNGELEGESHKNRTILGQERYLNQYSDAKGVLTLANTKAHWWILKKEEAVTKQNAPWASIGHMAILYQDELYEMTTGRSSTSSLQDFGISMGHQRVVVYLEPDVKKLLKVTTDTARTRLLIEDQPFPWADLAAEFREKMPAEIVKLIENCGEPTRTNNQDRIKDRLSEISELFKVPSRRARQGDPIETTKDGQQLNILPPSTTSKGNSTNTKNNDGNKTRETTADIFAAFTTSSNQRAKAKKELEIPKIRWLSLLDGSRTMNDMEGRAARYIASSNELQINADFHVFTDAVNHICQQHHDKPGIKPHAETTMREWYAQTLIETVFGAKALAGTRNWSGDSSKMLLSEEGLTSAVLGGRWLHLKRVALSFSVKIGRIHAQKAQIDDDIIHPPKLAEPL